MNDLERLKGYLLESTFPTFEDSDLQSLLDLHSGDVGEAAFDGCMQKAQDDSISLGPIKLNSNEKFWLRRAGMVKAMEYKYQRANNAAPTKRISARRFDD